MRRVFALVVLAGALAGLLVTASRGRQPAAFGTSNSPFAEEMSPACPMRILPDSLPTSGPLCTTHGEAERVQEELGWYPALGKGETILVLVPSQSAARP